MDKDRIMRSAVFCEWGYKPDQPDPHYMRFTKGVKTLDVYTSTGTVRFIEKPWGKVVYHKDCTDLDVEEMLETYGKMEISSDE